MPRRCATKPGLSELVHAQDFVLDRTQAFEYGLTPGAIKRRLRDQLWQVLLPEVYLTHPGEPSRRQLLIAALLYAGPDAAIDDVDACRYHGLRTLAVDDDCVRVVAPLETTARSRRAVVVRRTAAPIVTENTERIRYLALAPALIAATRRYEDPCRVLAVLSDAVQRKLVTFDQLMTAHIQGPRRNAHPADEALAQIAAGIRSAPEGGFRNLAEASLVLPPLLYNCLLRLPGGELISPDALALDAGLVHETNGARAHRRLDLFEDTMVRHTLMTTADLVVLHNSPTRIDRHGRLVLAQFERCYLRYKGRGLPPGVELLRAAA
ncbi:MAG: hypothetical protein ACJ735_11820 [Actinomycetes bacterium]